MSKIKSLFSNKAVILNLNAKTKAEALAEIALHLKSEKFISDEKVFLAALEKREGEFSTGLGEGIAIPHAQSDVVTKDVVLVARSKDGLDWNALDAKPVHVLFAIALNTQNAASQIDVLQELAVVMQDADLIAKVRFARTSASVIKVLSEFNAVKAESTASSGARKIIAITACPTGIAHTYLAAEALVKAANELDLGAKVETQGRATENALTAEDIASADAIIFAIDKKIDNTERFAGKLVYQTGTKEAIKDSKGVIAKALAGVGSRITTTKGDKSGAAPSELSWRAFKDVYKNLMGGVSRMLPFVVAGGILLGLAFLLDSGITGQNFGVTREVSRWFAGLGRTAFSVFVPVLGGYVAYSIVGAEGLLPGFVAGIIASGGGSLYAEGSGGIAITTGWTNLWGSATPGVDQGVLAAGSGFIGAMVGGYIAAAFVVTLRKHVFHKVNKHFQGMVSIIAMPVLTVLLTGVVMFALQIPLAYFAYGLKLGLEGLSKNNLLALLGVIIGLMMAFDMGGPVNKVAYAFGTGLLSNATPEAYQVMATVMIGGMTPPFIIAFATLVARKSWSLEDRSAGITNWLMGAFFITEGAIPFAAKDPKRVIPSLMLGAAIASGIVGGLSIGVSAPHGGVFVFALLRSYLFNTDALQIGLGVAFTIGAIAIGMVVGGFTLNFLKKFGQKKPSEVIEVPVMATPSRKSWLRK